MADALLAKVRSIRGLIIEIWLSDLEHAVNGHPEVTIDKVKETLRDPAKVIRSKSSSSACLFYNIKISSTSSVELYFCVVVAVMGAGRGKMITAYDADFIKSGDELYSKN